MFGDINLDKKQRNNKFTNYQRSDRNGGEKLEKNFCIKNNISFDTDLEIIEEKCHRAIMIFDQDGFLDYFSGKIHEPVVQFYRTKVEFYLVKNFKAFCK